MKRFVSIIAISSSLLIGSAHAEVRPRPAAAAQPQYSDESVRTYLQEQNFAECESSPGGTAIVPTQQLLGLETPATGTPRVRTRTTTSGGQSR